MEKFLLTNQFPAIVVPVVTAILGNPKWPSWAKAVLAFVLCVGAAFLQAYQQGGLSDADLLTKIITIVSFTASMYLGFLKHVGLDGLERWTSGLFATIRESAKQQISGDSSGDDRRPKDITVETVEEKLARAKNLLDSNLISEDAWSAMVSGILKDFSMPSAIITPLGDKTND